MPLRYLATVPSKHWITHHWCFHWALGLVQSVRPIKRCILFDTRSFTILQSCSKFYSVSQKKIPPWDFLAFFPNGWEFFVQILHACYMFLSTLEYKFLFNYLQLWRSYAILSATTQFTSYVQNVHHWPKRELAFSDIFPKQLRIFSPNFTSLLYVPMYVRLQIFIQLSPTLTKLCHIKCDHIACISADGAHFKHMMVVALNMA